MKYFRSHQVVRADSRISLDALYTRLHSIFISALPSAFSKSLRWIYTYCIYCMHAVFRWFNVPSVVSHQLLRRRTYVNACEIAIGSDWPKHSSRYLIISLSTRLLFYLFTIYLYHAFPRFSPFLTVILSPLPLSLYLSPLDVNPVAYFSRRRQPEGFRKYFARLFSTRLWREAPKDSHDKCLKEILPHHRIL